jgi:ribonuclease D
MRLDVLRQTGEKSAAMSVELPETHLRSFSNEEINALPLRRYEGPVDIVRTEAQRRAAMKRLRAEPVLGFDTETRPVFRKGQKPNLPALIQLATAERVYLFQLEVLPFSDGLCDLVADRGLVKAGVSVRDDVRDLQKLTRFSPGGFVDLGEVSHKLNMQTHGLRNLAANLLGFRISKAAQCSNWAKQKLTRQQITYAATDAWVSRELYLAFQDLGAL